MSRTRLRYDRETIAHVALNSNVNFPTLLIKRFRKGNSASFNLSSFVTTEAGKSLYQAAAQRRGTDIIVVDDRVETRDPHSLNPGSVLLSVLERRDDSGGVFYLDRPMREAVDVDVRLRRWMVEGEGEYELSGSSATNSEDDEFDARSSNGFQQRGLQPIDLTGSPGSQPRLSPLPRTPTHANSFGSPSSTPPKTPGGTSRPRPPRLKRIDTSENLLGSRKNSASSAVGRTASRSPSAPALRVDASCANNRGAAPTSSMSLQSICHMQAKSPAATATRFAEADLTLPSTSSSSSHPASSSNPSSPEDEPRTSVADVPRFIVSTIIPGFLYLGPEPTSSKDLDELERLGVKEVLNLALECEDKDGEVGRRFELRKIGMRDFVEETGVQQAIEEACRILGEYLRRSAKSLSLARKLTRALIQATLNCSRSRSIVTAERASPAPSPSSSLTWFIGEFLLSFSCLSKSSLTSTRPPQQPLASEASLRARLGASEGHLTKCVSFLLLLLGTHADSSLASQINRYRLRRRTHDLGGARTRSQVLWRFRHFALYPLLLFLRLFNFSLSIRLRLPQQRPQRESQPPRCWSKPLRSYSSLDGPFQFGSRSITHGSLDDASAVAPPERESRWRRGGGEKSARWDLDGEG